MTANANQSAECNSDQCVRIKSGTQASVGDLLIGIMRCTDTACRLSVAPAGPDDRDIIFMARPGDKITIGTTSFTLTGVSDEAAEFELRD